jgi:MFS family permease
MLDAVINIGVEPYEIGIFFGILGITMMLGNIGFGKLSDIRGRKWLIVIGAMVGAVSLVMFMYAHDVISLYTAGVVLSIGMSMRGPAIQALIADITDPSSYGIVMGVFGAVSNSAYAVSPLIGGKVFDDTGSAAISLLIAAGVSVAGGVFAAVFIPGDASETTCVIDTHDDQKSLVEDVE